MTPRPSNFYFPNECFVGIRRRLLRLSSNLHGYTSPDSLYDEILDCFTALGVERQPRTDRSIPDLPWTAFISDVELEVLESLLVFLFFKILVDVESFVGNKYFLLQVLHLSQGANLFEMRYDPAIYISVNILPALIRFDTFFFIRFRYWVTTDC